MQLEPVRGYVFERLRLRRRRVIIRSISADASALEDGQANERFDAYAILRSVASCRGVGGLELEPVKARSLSPGRGYVLGAAYVKRPQRPA